MVKESSYEKVKTKLSNYEHFSEEIYHVGSYCTTEDLGIHSVKTEIP